MDNEFGSVATLPCVCIGSNGSFDSSSDAAARCGGFSSAASKRNARSLRDSSNPTELERVLSEVWTEVAEETCPFFPEPGQCCVHNLNVNEILFDVERVFKNLISYCKLDDVASEAKTAAIDVFTWICCKFEVKKGLHINVGMILDWVTSLLEDSSTVLIGLRGLHKLAADATYQQSIVEHEQFVLLLKRLDLRAEDGCDSFNYVAKIYRRCLLNGVQIPGHEDVLRQIINVSRIVPSKDGCLTCWCAACIQIMTISSEFRVRWTAEDMVNNIIRRVAEDKTRKLIEDRVAVYLSWHAASHCTQISIDNWLKTEAVVQQLVANIEQDSENSAVGISLLANIARGDPRWFFDRCISIVWMPLQHILVKGNPNEQANALETWNHALNWKGTTKCTLPDVVKDGGLKLVLLLRTIATEKKVDALYGLWMHFKEVQVSFLKAWVLSWLLSRLFDLSITDMTSGLAIKIKKLASVILEDNGTGVHSGLGDCIQSHSDSDPVHRNHMASQLIDILKKATAHRKAADTAKWLIREGLDNILQWLSAQHVYANTRKSLLSLLLNIANTVDPNSDVRQFSMKFDRIFTASKFLSNDDFKQLLQHNWEQEHLNACEYNKDNRGTELARKGLDESNSTKSSSSQTGGNAFSVETFERLCGWIESRSDFGPEFLGFLLKKLADNGRNVPGYSWADKTLKQLLSCVKRWTKMLAKHTNCSVQLLRALAFAIGRCPTETLKSAVSSFSSGTGERLWSLFLHHGMSDAITTAEMRNLGKCIDFFVRRQVVVGFSVYANDPLF